MRIVPKPMGTPAMTWGAGLMRGLLVQANQKRPMGREMLPRIMSKRRVSCIRPAWTFGAKRVFVVSEIRAQPKSTPINIARKGRAATPDFQRLCSVYEMGKASKKR